MRFDELVETFSRQPLVRSESLLVMGEEPKKLSVQLSRWVSAGKLVRLRRGLYALGERYRRIEIVPEHVANQIVHPSYVSLERALSIHGLIPEAVPLVQSVTTRRTVMHETALGTYSYRYVKRTWFTGYEEMELETGRALAAIPEKALLDLVYLSKGEFGMKRIEELRLQDVGRLEPETIERLATGEGSPRMIRAARNLVEHLAMHGGRG